MAGTPLVARALTEDLLAASIPAGKRELEELTVFAKSHLDHPTPLAPWDILYVGEHYRKSVLKYSEEEIAQYFNFDKVIGGLFALAEEALSIKVEELDQKKEGITTWE